MGQKNKLAKWADNLTFGNIYQPKTVEVLNTNYPLKGKWNAEVFKNNYPIVLELGCGKGEYSVGLAKHFPNKNFIGLDIKGNRIWKGAKEAFEKNMNNVIFIRTRIDFITSLFNKNEVDEIWITFPDPQIKYKRTKHRLTNTGFLQKYKYILNNEGVVHLKTDSEFMHGYTLGLLHGEGHEILHANHDVYKNTYSPEEVIETQTFYEKQYLEKGKPITFIQFRINY